MPKDPSFIRLKDHMSDRSVADVQGGSGWGLSGNQVAKWPKNAKAQNFARVLIRRGQAESASKAEYDEQQKANEALRKVVKEQDHHDEQALLDAAEDLKAERTESTEDEDDA